LLTWRLIVVLGIFWLPTNASAADIPDGLSVIGLKAGQWHIYISENGQFQPVSTIDSPRTATYHHAKQQLAYIGVDGKLRLHSLLNDDSQEITSANIGSRFTQPNFSKDGDWLYVVELPNGKSRRTNIIGFDIEHDVQHSIVRKRTAQFEPFSDNNGYLYYTTAICVDDCEGMIWELWRRDILSGRQEQLTLLNALSSQPHASEDGWLYFTSNADAGRFHLWRMLPNVQDMPEQLTDGQYRDSSPTTSGNGQVYFLRKDSAGTSLMQWIDGVVTKISTPGMDDLRNLEMGR